MTLRSKFLLPIKAHLKANAKSQRIDLESKSAGREDIDNITHKALSERFGLPRDPKDSTGYR